MAGRKTYIRHYQKGRETITVSCNDQLTREGWDKLVRDRHGDGWEQVPAHKVLNPFPRVKKTGMLP